MDRREFGWASLFGWGVVKAAAPVNKIEQVFAQLHYDLCQSLINKTHGCIRTLHGCFRNRGNVVYDDICLWRIKKRGVFAVIDMVDWQFFRKIREKNPDYMPYELAVAADTSVKMTDDEWKEVLFMFRQAYPAP